MAAAKPRILFVTGKLAEPALRRVVAEVAATAGFEPEIAVLPITVAALMTTDWVARHFPPFEPVDRVVLPGLCRGELELVSQAANAPAEFGPKDLRDLPEHFGKRKSRPENYGMFDIEILAEINHAPRFQLAELFEIANRFRTHGADVIDLGCNPGETWANIGDVVRTFRSEGFRISVDSFNPHEVEPALAAGAELVLSVNSSNVDLAVKWCRDYPHVEFITIPDTPTDLESLERTANRLTVAGGRVRLDPILEPIGFGFAESLVRYREARRKYPHTPMMMGIGNVTELTDVDSAGVNVVLAGFCQELGIQSVLTTEVIPWCRSSVKEFDLARRLVYHSVKYGVLPKHLEPSLIMLRDRKLFDHGPEGLAELARRVTDRNYRLFAEGGSLHLINGQMHLEGTDPFALFQQVLQTDEKMDSSHAFYLGYEFAKAVTALTLGKQYNQDQALDWGFLTRHETTHRNPG